MNGLSLWRQRYDVAGMATIPLWANSKEAVCNAWQFVAPATQWGEVGGDNYRGNIGVRCGNGYAVTDGDSPATVTALRKFFDGLGYAPVEVTTARPGRRHFYFRVKGVPADFNSCDLAVGPGELRAGPGAYVAAPCSEVDDRRYRFLSGDPETVAGLRPIAWRDLAALVGTTPTAARLAVPPVRLIRRDMPFVAAQLFAALHGAPKGRPVAGYPSRSEAEAAITAMLILSGWEYSDICNAFAGYLPGHYREKSRRHRAAYVRLTYHKALGMLAGTPERQELASLYHAAQGWPWPGRCGGGDRAVYSAVLAIAWQFSSYEVNTSQRCLAEDAAMSRRSVSNALARLRKGEDALIGRAARDKDWTHAHRYYVYAQKVARSHIPIPSPSDSKMIVAAGGGDDDAQNCELWGRSALGKSAALVYAHLPNGGGLSVGDLARFTGKHRNTCAAALRRLVTHALAAKTPTGWRRGPAALADVASDLDCEAAARRRRARHAEERERWREGGTYGANQT